MSGFIRLAAVPILFSRPATVVSLSFAFVRSTAGAGFVLVAAMSASTRCIRVVMLSAFSITGAGSMVAAPLVVMPVMTSVVVVFAVPLLPVAMRVPVVVFLLNWAVVSRVSIAVSSLRITIGLAAAQWVRT